MNVEIRNVYTIICLYIIAGDFNMHKISAASADWMALRLGFWRVFGPGPNSPMPIPNIDIITTGGKAGPRVTQQHGGHAMLCVCIFRTENIVNIFMFVTFSCSAGFDSGWAGKCHTKTNFYARGSTQGSEGVGVIAVAFG